MQPPLAVSTAGPHVVVPGSGFTIYADLADSGRDLAPTTWQWVCTAASGSPCFTGIDVPDPSAGVWHIKPGMMLPGDYVIKVRCGPRSPSGFQTYHILEAASDCNDVRFLFKGFGRDGRQVCRGSPQANHAGP